MIVTQTGGVTLIGGGEISGADVAAALACAPYLVAADGGAQAALDLGHCPDATLGDLDSLGPEARAKLPAHALHHIPEQESTDFEKCLREISAPYILGVGFLGARLDHTLAVLSALVRHRGAPLVLIGAQDVVVHLRAPLRMRLWEGARVSLMPLAPVRGSSRGLVWPIDGLELAPTGQIATSNRAIQAQVEITAEGPGLLCLVPRAALDAVLEALGICHGPPPQTPL